MNKKRARLFKYIVYALLAYLFFLAISQTFGIIVHLQDIVLGTVLFSILGVAFAIYRPEDNNRSLNE